LQLVDAVCRPPRDTYDEQDLVGGTRATFSFGESRSRIKKYYRQDVELVREHNNAALRQSPIHPSIIMRSIKPANPDLPADKPHGTSPPVQVRLRALSVIA